MVMVSCSQSTTSYCAEAAVAPPGDVVVHCGLIDQASVDRTIGSIGGQSRTLYIDSLGGESVHAIRLGRAILEHDLELMVGARCLSACAHFVLPASKQVQLSYESQIGFHHTGSAIVELLSGCSQCRHSDFLENATIEAEYYADLGIDQRFLHMPFEQLSIEQVTVDPRQSNPRLFMTLRYKGENFIQFPDESISTVLGAELVRSGNLPYTFTDELNLFRSGRMEFSQSAGAPEDIYNLCLSVHLQVGSEQSNTIAQRPIQCWRRTR